MTYEKTKTYDVGQKELLDFQTIVEKSLKKMDFVSKSAQLDNTLTIVTFLDEAKDKSVQKDNKIAIYKEDNSVYIQVKGSFSENEASSFWSAFDAIYEEKKNRIDEPEISWTMERSLEGLEFLPPDQISSILKITKKLTVERKKQVIDRLNEIENEFKQLERKGLKFTPKEKADLRLDLMKLTREMRQEQMEKIITKKGIEIDERSQENVINDIFESIESRGYNISLSDAKEFVENFQSQFKRLPKPTEMDSIANGYIKMMQEEMDQSRPETVEPEAAETESEPEAGLEVDTEPETQEIIDEQSALDPSITGFERELRMLGFLTEVNIVNIKKMTEKLPEDRKQQVLQRIKDIEEEIDATKEEGVELTDYEKGEFREELIKYTKSNRKEKLMELIRPKKEDLIREKLFAEIPQLKFEDNEKIMKELLWLKPDEMDSRILKIKENMEKQLKKKQKLFEESSAGSTCSECGWPVGSFSKKCPRCGKKLIDWLD